MKTTNVILLIIALLVGGLIYVNLTVETPLASVAQTSEYNYTQLTGAIATSTQIFGGRGTLGSVIITEDQAGAVVLYDATSTASIGTALPVRIADFQSAETEGVYTFDTFLKYGLVMVSADGFSFAGDWTITWRR